MLYMSLKIGCLSYGVGATSQPALLQNGNVKMMCSVVVNFQHYAVTLGGPPASIIS